MKKVGAFLVTVIALMASLTHASATAIQCNNPEHCRQVCQDMEDELNENQRGETHWRCSFVEAYSGPGETEGENGRNSTHTAYNCNCNQYQGALEEEGEEPKPGDGGGRWGRQPIFPGGGGWDWRNVPPRFTFEECMDIAFRAYIQTKYFMTCGPNGEFTCGGDFRGNPELGGGGAANAAERLWKAFEQADKEYEQAVEQCKARFNR